MSAADCPAQIVGEFTATTGNGFTVTVEVAEAVQLFDVPVTVYVVVVAGETEIPEPVDPLFQE